jgi:DNA-binding transcriptional regulator YiaG
MNGVAGMGKGYHYLESGLDNVHLVGGFEFSDGPSGRTVTIHDIDGLHRTIAHALINKRQRLTGKEFRFLRTELLMSQATLAHVLGVRELTVARWEKGHSDIPVATDAALRQMYAESHGQHPRMREVLDRIADLEDKIDQLVLSKLPKRDWQVVREAA